MIVFNSTILPDWSIAQEWLSWIQREYIPAVLSTGFFEQYNLYQLLDQDEEQGPTYVLQFFASSTANYRAYLLGFAEQHHEQALAKWGNQFVVYRTVMQRID
jgi:hypothetical protein